MWHTRPAKWAASCSEPPDSNESTRFTKQKRPVKLSGAARKKADLGEAGQQRHGAADARQRQHGRAAPRLVARQLDQRSQGGGGGLALRTCG